MKKITILVIDDHENLAKCVVYSIQDILVKMNLEDVEFEILPASGPCKGIQYFSQKVIDMMITDLEMPKLDGERLLRIIAKMSPATFLALMTANDQYQLPDDLRTIDIIRKPFSEKELEQVMNKALEYLM